MKIAIHTDPHFSFSAYGIQSQYLVDHLKKANNRVFIVPKSNLIMARAVEIDGYSYYPGMNQWGNGGVNALVKKWQPDLLISHLDPWITEYQDTSKWIAWCPVDHDPMPPGELEKLKKCLLPVAVTKFSFKQMQDEGLDPMYCPYGIDFTVMYPDEAKRKKFRDKLELKDADYLIGMVGVNQYERKGYAQAFQAFKQFKKNHPEAYLYVQADPYDVVGLDLFEMAKSIGIDVFFPDLFAYREGIGMEDLAYVYNSFDVFFTTTHGEGFGIPIIEAQSCGVPVIATDFMGIPELNPYGLHIKCQPDFSPHKSWLVTPIIEDAVRCLEEMFEKRHDIDKAQLVEFVKQYDFKEILKIWDTIIERALNILSQSEHEHVWSVLANHTLDGEVYVPCQVKGCECGLVVTGDKPNEVRHGLYKPEYNGVHFDIEDDPKYGVWKIVLGEMPNNQLDDIGLNKDSVCIDIGAQVGVISTYIAKKYGCGVLAYEPMTDNFERLQRNIKVMGVQHLVKAKNVAVYDGKPVKMNRGETGLTGSGRVGDYGDEYPSVDLNVVLDQLDHVDVLKIDCEGSEYQILYKLSKKNLCKIRHLRGEFHEVPGQDIDMLEEYCKCYVPDTIVVKSGITK
jgi:FkbM family methyltransferase